MGKQLIICLSIAGSLAATSAPAADVERGRLLYETRCTGCHDKSVHNQTARKALTVAAVRAQVRRWDAALGGTWRDVEVNDVTAYLNQRYYGYPCPQDDCPELSTAPSNSRR
jgi:mono/diheme cytochrome c family protein